MQQEIFNELGLATRLRRLMSRMTPDAEVLQYETGIKMKASYFPVIYSLHHSGAMPIRDIAKLAGFSHSAVSQTVKKLRAMGWVQDHCTDDGREKQIALSDMGEGIVDQLSPVWRRTQIAVGDAMLEANADLLTALTRMEKVLDQQSLYQRVKDIEASEAAGKGYRIVAYNPSHRQAFYDLNAAWVEKYFIMEPIDQKVLSDPEGQILAGGGEIYMAVKDDGTAFGAVAMKDVGGGRLELTKLAVDPTSQGSGVGRALCQKVIDRFQEQSADVLFLETSKILTPAISLYWKLGFVETKPPVPGTYERANYYMEWRG